MNPNALDNLLGTGTTGEYVQRVFASSDGTLTSLFYKALEGCGPLGLVALNVFRAQKRSNAAKRYRKGRWKREAYAVKNYAMGELANTLMMHGSALGISWGWGYDAPREPHSWVLYVQLSDAWQCSYHTGLRGVGPDFSGAWDGGSSERAMLAFVAHAIDVATSPKA